MTDNTTAIFDGHNDMLLRLWKSGQASPETLFYSSKDQGHVNAIRARQGHLVGGFCAIFAPSVTTGDFPDGAMPTLDHQSALSSTLGMAALLKRIERLHPDQFKTCRSISDIEAAIANKQFAAIFHIEGAEAISQNLDELYVLYEAGLRSLGPVWSRSNIFAHGVPFKFPASPDIGDGLTETGKALIRACNELHILIDLSHMNEKGFWDIAKLSDAPLVATHSNAHQLCQSSRNLTDKQIDAIGERDGVIGLNYGVKFLREDGVRNTATPLELIARHAAYIADRIGIEHVALGSDFDGTTIPDELSDASRLPNLVATFRQYGFDDESLEKIGSQNWLRVLKATWGT